MFAVNNTATNEVLMRFVVLQLTNEPHFSQGMFHFDYRVGNFSFSNDLFSAARSISAVN